MADERRVRLEDREGVMLLTFDRPPVNAMHAASAAALQAAFKEIDAAPPPAELLARAIEQGRRLGIFTAYDRIKAQYRARPYAEVAEILERGSDPMLERRIDRLSS
jgi:enoyl-CoA hydratase/carnithine racemase